MDPVTEYVLRELALVESDEMRRRVESLLSKLPPATVKKIEEALAPPPEPDPNQMDIFAREGAS